MPPLETIAVGSQEAVYVRAQSTFCFQRVEASSLRRHWKPSRMVARRQSKTRAQNTFLACQADEEHTRNHPAEVVPGLRLLYNTTRPGSVLEASLKLQHTPTPSARSGYVRRGVRMWILVVLIPRCSFGVGNPTNTAPELLNIVVVYSETTFV